MLAVRVVCANDVPDAIKTESVNNQIAHLAGMTLSSWPVAQASSR